MELCSSVGPHALDRVLSIVNEPSLGEQLEAMLEELVD